MGRGGHNAFLVMRERPPTFRAKVPGPLRGLSSKAHHRMVSMFPATFAIDRNAVRFDGVRVASPCWHCRQEPIPKDGTWRELMGRYEAAILDLLLAWSIRHGILARGGPVDCSRLP